MDIEQIRDLCLSLPDTNETLNWGHHLVYWVGDRDLGGKMFAIADADGSGPTVLAFPCGPERFHELQEEESVRAEPHLARAHWVALEHWDALPARQLEEELRRAHAITLEKLSKRAKAILALPKKEQATLLRQGRKQLKAAGKVRSTAAFGRKSTT